MRGRQPLRGRWVRIFLGSMRRGGETFIRSRTLLPATSDTANHDRNTGWLLNRPANLLHADLGAGLFPFFLNLALGQAQQESRALVVLPLQLFLRDIVIRIVG